MRSPRSRRRAVAAVLGALVALGSGRASAQPSSGRAFEEKFPGASSLGEKGSDVDLHGRELALHTMRATQAASPLLHDFLRENGIETPMPVVPGAIPEHARVKFPSDMLSTHGDVRADLMVIFTIGDFDDEKNCSTYYAPDSPWYNVFYGAYGVSSKKRDGSFWGYDGNGNPNFDEMLKVPELDYNFLTAGQLGCPPEKRIFRVVGLDQKKQGIWDRGDVAAIIPSGLHRWTPRANQFYYAVFGVPHPDLVDGKDDYEPVQMRGRMFFRRVTEAKTDEPITLVWGAMCPDTPAGNALLLKILAQMAPRYHVSPEEAAEPLVPQ